MSKKNNIIFKRKMTKVNSSRILKVNIPREVIEYFSANPGDYLEFIITPEGVKIEVDYVD